jgi:glycosidase
MDPLGEGDLSKGIDGWRLDVAYEVGHPFWKDWRKHVRSINPEAYLVAEVIDTPEKLKPYLQGDEFDAVMNYNFDFICSEYFINKDISSAKFDTLLGELREAFSKDVNLAMQNLLGSHDTDRPSSRISNKGIASFLEWQDYFGIGKSGTPEYKTSKPSEADYDILKMMAAFQMAYPGAPMIYYGDEVGMWGAGDPDCRKPMLWEDIAYDNEAVGPDGDEIDPPNPVMVNPGLFDYYKKLIRIRKSHPALQNGGYHTLLANDGTYAFMRAKGKDMVVPVFNNNDIQKKIEIKNIPAGDYINEFNGDSYTVEESGLLIELDGNSAAIFSLSGENK